MTKAEKLYRGAVGAAYWERNRERLDREQRDRAEAIHALLPTIHEPWLEVGCGEGHNLFVGDVGLDCDPRRLALFNTYDNISVVGSAYSLPFPDEAFPVVFSVGCLMHLPSGEGESWQAAVAEMARCSSRYVLIGEYMAMEEEEIPWHGERDVLWARPYFIPGCEQIRETKPLRPFDAEIIFQVWRKR